MRTTKQILITTTAVVTGLWLIGQMPTDHNASQMQTTSTVTQMQTTPAPAVIAPPAEKTYPVSNAGFEQVSGEVGCRSKNGDEKKADIFNSLYKDHMVTWSGTVSEGGKEKVMVKADSLTLASDFYVTLKAGQSAYDLQKGQPITVRFVLTKQAGCFLPFYGDEGVILGRETQS